VDYPASCAIHRQPHQQNLNEHSHPRDGANSCRHVGGVCGHWFTQFAPRFGGLKAFKNFFANPALGDIHYQVVRQNNAHKSARQTLAPNDFPLQSQNLLWLISSNQYSPKSALIAKNRLIYLNLKKVLLATAIIAVIYLGFLYLNLNIIQPISDDEVIVLINKYTVKEDAKDIPDTNRLIIGKIGVDIEIFEGDESVLKKGIWHRLEQRGDPEMGGNFILSGHRFSIGATAESIKIGSPLYHLEKLEIGDTFIVIWNKKYYEYVIFRKFKVTPFQNEIEGFVEKPVLTLYTCTLSGASDGRDVLQAQLL
jgi:sortase (surface protein transpeptidase)